MKNRGFLITALMFALFPLSTHAGIYKWVDEKGVTHYGDKPKAAPGNDGAASEAEQIHVHGGKIFDQVKELIPIPYQGKSEAPLILLNELIIKLKGADRDDIEIGTRTASKWNSCINPKPIFWSEGFVDVTDSTLMSAVVVPFDEAKYRMITGNIMNVSNTAGRLELNATINRIRLDICQYTASKGKSKAAAYVNISWQLQDRLTRTILYSARTEGAENGFDRFKTDGAEKAVTRAVSMAARNLLADEIFVRHVVSVDSHNVTAQTFDELKIGLRYGDAQSTFKQEIERLKTAAVTVRTATGHGSGVIIDKAGYILTNAHVVNDTGEVIVLVNNLELPGKVMRNEPHRDVALIKTQPLTTTSAASISRTRITEGDTIYVMGTPLDESLSNTVTKGVYSAFREQNGLTFYQTDAAINPGNSGGPVFDERGELIAISVAGVFTRSGASMNVNYLIPIEDALQALNLVQDRDYLHLIKAIEGSAASENTTTTVEKLSRAETGTSTVASSKTATDLYLGALEQKRLNNYSVAREKLQEAVQHTNSSEKEYQYIQDEMYIELPLAEARYFLQQHDAVRVNSTLEPVIGYLKTHPKRIDYMRQVEEILAAVGYLKQHQQMASKDKVHQLKQVLRQHLSMNYSYPKTKQALIALLQEHPGLLERFDIRAYRSDGDRYKLVVFDKDARQEYTLEDS